MCALTRTVGSNPTPSAILLRALLFAGFDATLDAKQDALRSLGEGGPVQEAPNVLRVPQPERSGSGNIHQQSRTI